MKTIAFILSIYIFAIAVMPCEDGIDMAISENVELTHSDGSSHNHSENEGHKDNCTNFCLCQCCSTPISSPSLLSYNEINERMLLSYSFQYVSLYSFDYSKGIWHPPIS